MVIQLLLVVRFLGGEVLVVAVSASLGGDDEPVDDRSVGVGGEVVAGDGGADRSGGHLSEGEEMVLSGGGSGGYWSMGSGSKESRYSGTWEEGTWLRRGELFKRRIDESGGSGAVVAGGVGLWGLIASDMRHGLVTVMKGAVGQFTIPVMYRYVVGPELVAEVKDAVGARFGGVEVVLGTFEDSEVFNGEVF